MSARGVKGSTMPLPCAGVAMRSEPKSRALHEYLISNLNYKRLSEGLITCIQAPGPMKMSPSPRVTIIMSSRRCPKAGVRTVQGKMRGPPTLRPKS